MIARFAFTAWALIFAWCGSSLAQGEPSKSKVAAMDLACTTYAAPIQRGTISSKKIVEASGIAASRRNPGVYFVHNDSDDQSRVFAIDETGRNLGRFTIKGVPAIDWEDIAVGPAMNEAGTFIYVGDIGDNHHDRSTISVVRVPEPTVVPGHKGGKQKLSGAVVLNMRYPGGGRYNAEALLFDPSTSDLLVMTKVRHGEAKLFRYPAPQDPSKIVTLELVASAQVGDHFLSLANQVTGGDVSFDGTRIVLRTYSQVLVWRRTPGQSIGEALTRPACYATNHTEAQGEAVAWSFDGSAFLTVSEGAKQPIYFFASQP